MRTSGTAGRTQAGALGMLRANSIFVGIPIIVGRRFAYAVPIIALVVETKVIAARVEVIDEGLGSVGDLGVGVYLLEGRGQGGLVKGGVARKRAVLARARGLRGVYARCAAGDSRKGSGRGPRDEPLC